RVFSLRVRLSFPTRRSSDLVLFRIRNVVIELILQLKGLPHMLFSLSKVLLEHLNGFIAIGCLSETDFLFGSRDGVIGLDEGRTGDRKSTRLNSSHVSTSYAV